MNDSNEKSDMPRDIAIFDYVADNLSKSAKLNFEKMMAQDAALRDAVEAERRFREDMLKTDHSQPVSMSSFESLLGTIEAREQQDSQDPKVSLITPKANAAELTKASYYSSPRYYATAASVAVIAVMFAGFYLNSSAPKFETLSNTPASTKINFAELTEQARLAKMTLAEQLSQQQIEEILRDYNLTSFEAGVEFNQRYVISETAISQSELERWRNDPRIQQVELFKNSDGG